MKNIWRLTVLSTEYKIQSSKNIYLRVISYLPCIDQVSEYRSRYKSLLT